MSSQLSSLERLGRAPLEWGRETVSELRKSLFYRRRDWRADRAHESPTVDVHGADGPDHVLVVAVDAFRPGKYLLPTLGLETTTAIAPSTWTFPSVTSLLTGLYPHNHGAVAHTAPSDEEFALPTQTTVEPRLPELFEGAGYDTFGSFAFSMPLLAAEGWFDTHRVFSDAPAERVLGTYESWRRGRERTFAYLHLGDLHAPLTPPGRYVDAHDVDTDLEDLEHIAAYTTDYTGTEEQRYYRSQKLGLYEAGVDYVTDELGSTIEPLLADTLVVVTGDHGEALYEHAPLDRQFTDSRPNYGVGHGGTPLDQVARVPLGVSHPGEDLRPTGGWASLCDVPTTLSDICLDIDPMGPDGVSWLEPIPDDRAVLCEGVRYGSERKAVYRGDRKLVYSRADDESYLASVTPDDDDEQLLDETDDEELRSILQAVWDDSDGDRGDTRNVDERVSKQLQSLGYT